MGLPLKRVQVFTVSSPGEESVLQQEVRSESSRLGWRKIFLMFLRVDVNLAWPLKMWYLECFWWIGGWASYFQHLGNRWQRQDSSVRLPLGVATLIGSSMELFFCYSKTFTMSGLACAVVIERRQFPPAGPTKCDGRRKLQQKTLAQQNSYVPGGNSTPENPLPHCFKWSRKTFVILSLRTSAARVPLKTSGATSANKMTSVGD